MLIKNLGTISDLDDTEVPYFELVFNQVDYNNFIQNNCPKEFLSRRGSCLRLHRRQFVQYTNVMVHHFLHSQGRTVFLTLVSNMSPLHCGRRSAFIRCKYEEHLLHYSCDRMELLLPTWNILLDYE